MTESDSLLVILMMGFAAVMLVQVLQQRPAGFQYWAGVIAAVIAVGAASLYFDWRWRAWIVGTLFVPFLLMPIVLSGVVRRAVLRGDFARAAQATLLLSWLVPWQAVAAQRRLYAAMAHERTDDVVAALARLKGTADRREHALIDGMVGAERGDWAAVIAAVHGVPALAAMEIRAHGEQGDVDRMLQVYAQYADSLESDQLNYARLFVTVFTGQFDAAARILAGPLAGLSADMKQYWSALALLARDPENAAAREALRGLATSSKRESTRRAAERHFARAVARSGGGAAAPPVLPLDAAVAADIGHDVDDQPLRLRHAPATLILLAANILAYIAFAVLVGPPTARNFAAVGGLWPDAVIEGGAWSRLVSAAFLHSGLLHLAMNMIALGSIGPEVERFRGIAGTLGAFVGIAVVSNAMVLWLMRADVLDENVLIGASGAIMGFIGMIAARFLGNWWFGRKRRDFGRLVNLAILLALQAVIDISVPQISGTAHACGFLTGLALGGLLYRADAAEAPR